MPNTNWKATRIAVILSVVFFLGIFAPSWFGMDGFDGGFALATFSGFFMLMAVISAFVLGSLAKQQDRLFAGQDLLAHWKYTKDEWAQYFAEEAVRDREGKKMLFYIVTFWAVLFGIAFPVFDHEDGIFVSYVMLGLIVLIGAVAWLSIRITYHRLQKHGGEAWIGTKGAFIAGQMYSWNESSLTGITYFDDPKQALLEIEFLGGKTEYTVRIPVPTGKAQEAQQIAQTMGKRSYVH